MCLIPLQNIVWYFSILIPPCCLISDHITVTYHVYYNINWYVFFWKFISYQQYDFFQQPVWPLLFADKNIFKMLSLLWWHHEMLSESTAHAELSFPSCWRPECLGVTPHKLPLKQANSFKGFWLEVYESSKCIYLQLFRRNVHIWFFEYHFDVRLLMFYFYEHFPCCCFSV